MHTNYGRGVRLISVKGRVWTLVLMQRLLQDPSNVCRRVRSATFGVSPRTGHMLACEHFDLLLRMLFH